MPTRPVEVAFQMLGMSIRSTESIMHDEGMPLALRLRWTASELERLAGEAYRIADEAEAEQ